MLYLLCPREVRDVDESVYAFLKLYEDAEVGEVANLCCVLAAYRVLNLDSLPRIFLKLLDAERHLALCTVECEDNCLYLVAYVEELLC